VAYIYKFIVRKTT